MNDEQLREWYQARRARPDAGDHPSPEAMVALIRREGSETERMACLDHVIGCDACRPEFELLRSIDGAGSTPIRRALPGWLPLAAGVALAAGAASLWLLLRAPDQTLRSGGASTVTLVTPVGGSAERPLRFTWRSVPTATSYRLELLTEDGRLVFAKDQPDTTAALPDSLPVPAGKYRWWVSARSTEGVVESQLESISIR